MDRGAWLVIVHRVAKSQKWLKQLGVHMSLPLITYLMEEDKEEKGMTEDEVVGWITNSVDMSLSKLQELVMDKEV